MRVMTRTPERCEDLARQGVELVPGDLLDAASLENACKGVSSVVAAAHSLVGRGKYSSHVVDGAGSERLIAVAKQSGVNRMVYVSVHDAHPEHPIDFWRTKARVEQVVRTSGLNSVILRPTAFIDFHAEKLIGEPIRRGKPVVLFGKGSKARNFVAADDVAAFTKGLLERTDLQGETIDVGGPDTLSARDVVSTYEQHLGAKARVVALPLAMARSVSLLSRPLHPGVSRVLQTVIIAETNPPPFDYSAFAARFGVRFRSLREWLAERSAASS